jgi:hypothetical protein
MYPTRGQFEVFAAAVILSVCMGVVLARTLVVADRSQQQAIETAAAAFVAGIEMLQAESRLEDRRRLNALGYPTGRSGALLDDADCALIWGEATSNDPVVARFVGDSNAGDRCEYRLDGRSESAPRILYWPLGAAADVEAPDGDLRVTRGAHVHVVIGEASSRA